MQVTRRRRPCSWFFSAALIFAWAAGPSCADASDKSGADSSSSKPLRDDDEDGPDYYDGQDAPMGGTVNPESMGSRRDESDEEADSNKPPLWMDFTAQGGRSQQQVGSLSGRSEFKLGKHIPLGWPFDLYAKLAVNRDKNDLLWSNRAEAGVGLQVPLLKRIGLDAFGEIITGEYFHQASGLLELDSLDAANAALRAEIDSLALMPSGMLLEYRAGWKLSFAWGQKSESGNGGGEEIVFPFRFRGHLHSDGILSSLTRRVQTRHGGTVYGDSLAYVDGFFLGGDADLDAIMMEGPAGQVSAYLTGNLLFDTHQDWWNNQSSAGPGLAYRPFSNIDFTIKAEYWYGWFYGHENHDFHNPFNRNIRDFRLSTDLYYQLGR